MAAEVTKFSVFDPRIVQTKPKYAVEKGAASISNVPVPAQTADASACQFNVQVPSENVFVDRAVEWKGSLVATVVLGTTGPAIAAGTPLSGLVAPAAFPLHQAVSQMSATINDATVTVNTQDVLPQVLRLADMREARRRRTCPTMLDRYSAYPDPVSVKNSPLLLWDETKNSDEVPNGGFNGFYFATDSSGATPVGATGSYGGAEYVNGQPIAPTGGVTAGSSLTFHVVVTSVEKLLLPPFIFSDQYELSTGLFGVQNFQVQMNMAPSPKRTFRTARHISHSGGVTTLSVSSTTWSSNASKGQIWNSTPTLSVQFLTPSLDVPLPPKSIVPYMEFPRYISTPLTLCDASVNQFSKSTLVTSNTITLPNIPDLLVIYVKPSAYDSSADADWSLPITNISMNFDNFSGLLSTMTQQQLYQMSVNNGVDMDWDEWSGFGYVPAVKGAAGASIGGRVGLVGGPLVLRPGRDFPLSSGMAPGLVGNFSLQFNLNVQNQTGSDKTPNLYVIPVSSGFFETIKGSSRVIKGVLTEQDILGSPAAAPSSDLERPVGAGRKAGPKHSGMKAYM
jgi:hypothetical protein